LFSGSAYVRAAGWIAIALLIATGLGNLSSRWLQGRCAGPPPLDTSAGRVLGPAAAVTTMVVVSAVHDFALGPAASRAETGSDTAVALRRRAALLARVNALVGIVVVIAAVRLARG
jgi:hypothetical protein